MTGVFVLAATVTTVLSLDATVVLLMPVVVGAALAVGADPWPNAHTSLRMANSASLLLPVSNLTNLLALPHLGLSFAGFVGRDGSRSGCRADRGVRRASLAVPSRADGAAGRARRRGAVTGARFPVVVVGADARRASWSAASWAGIPSGARAPPGSSWWPGLVAVGWSPPETCSPQHIPGFAVLVLALGVVVAALSRRWVR